MSPKLGDYDFTSVNDVEAFCRLCNTLAGEVVVFTPLALWRGAGVRLGTGVRLVVSLSSNSSVRALFGTSLTAIHATYAGSTLFLGWNR